MAGNHPHHQEHRDLRRQESRRVALVGAVSNLALTLVKFVIGYIGQSQALIADAVHSLSDLLSDALVWFAAHHAAHGPDEEHPYGHGRFETAATLGLSGLLLAVAAGIIWDAIESMVEPSQLLVPDAVALYAALFSILVNEWLYWYTIIVARRIRSELLRANAWHHRSDAVSSVVVLIGIAGTLFGYGYLDAIAALVVGIMIAKIGWELGLGAMRELVDASLEEETVAKVRNIINDVHGVRSIHMLRTRRQGHEALADVHVQVAPWISVSEGHMVSMVVDERIRSEVDEITDVTVHIDPEDDETTLPCRGLPLRDDVMAQLRERWGDLVAFDENSRILLHYLSGTIGIDLFLPLNRYDGEAQTEALRHGLTQRLEGLAHFQKVRIYYGD